MSANGKDIIAGTTSNPDNLLTSNDYGVTWTTQTSLGQKRWSTVTISSDGKAMLAASGGTIYMSMDSGANWVNLNLPGNHPWKSIGISADYKYIVAAPYTNSIGDDIFISSDNGDTWIDQTDAGSGDWGSVTISSDGSRIFAADNGTNTGSFPDFIHNPGYIWSAYNPNAIAKLVIATTPSTPSSKITAPVTGFGTTKSDSSREIYLITVGLTIVISVIGYRRYFKIFS